jgi:UDPglucose 6-dehydrogenase
MRIAMIGAGYVGLVSGACFADFGHSVTCVDLDKGKIAELRAGVMPVFEPGLREMVDKNVREGRLRFSTDLATSVADMEAVFIAVGTPSRPGDGHADLSYVYIAAAAIARAATGPLVIIIKSTVPVGTSEEVELIARDTRPDLAIDVVSNPEFLREGAAIEDFKRPDRIIVGVENERARSVLTAIYRPLSLNRPPIVYVSRRTSELTKYAANGFLAMKIAYINEIADLCDRIGANVQDVARGIGLDKRIGAKFLHAGPGYGGSCFPKDTLALLKSAQDYGTPLRIVETVVTVNDQRRRAMGRKIIAACGGAVRGKTIAILGLTFKPNTDDLREAPALAIVTALQDAGATVRGYDPEGMKLAKQLLPDLQLAANAYDCVAGADAVAIVTEWDEFRALDLPRIKSLLTTPVLVDLRNIYLPEEVARYGLRYTSVGRPDVGQAEGHALSAKEGCAAGGEPTLRALKTSTPFEPAV